MGSKNGQKNQVVFDTAMLVSIRIFRTTVWGINNKKKNRSNKNSKSAVSIRLLVFRGLKVIN
jgi:hypothetical protein